MTRFAAPPPLRFIDVQMMEILVAVSEVCQRRCDLVMSDILLVTLKAQSVFFYAVGIIKFCREKLVEDLGVC